MLPETAIFVAVFGNFCRQCGRAITCQSEVPWKDSSRTPTTTRLRGNVRGRGGEEVTSAMKVSGDGRYDRGGMVWRRRRRDDIVI